MGAEVAAALDSAHTRTDDAGVPMGIVNRDVNPARIRLDPHGQVKLPDFGVALSRLTVLRRNPAERFATAAELEHVKKARLAQLGPYTGEDAVREVQRALVEAGDRLWDLGVPAGPLHVREYS